MNEIDPEMTAAIKAKPEDAQRLSVILDYTNYRGERSKRVIIPMAVRWGSNQWHPIQQWLLDAIDMKNGQARTFALKDILSWEPVRS